MRPPSTSAGRKCAALFSVVYAVTSDGSDVYADMALVSMISVGITNPELRIVAVCDDASAVALRRSRHRMLDVCDELVKIPTGAGHPTLRNRLLKTQLCYYVPGPCLYLDADTLVRGSLLALPSLTTDIGAVANNNAQTKEGMMWSGDIKFLAEMDWPCEYEMFVNGGVQFYHDTHASRHFYKTWHRLYLEGIERHTRQEPEATQDCSRLNIYWQDQPSLNAAIKESGVRCARLPDIFNLQMRFDARGMREAVVWHFWYALAQSDSCFTRLIAAAPHVKMAKLKRMVRRAILKPYPYPNQDTLGQHIGRKIESGRHVATFERIWLTNRRAALRFLAGGLKARIFAGRSKRLG